MFLSSNQPPRTRVQKEMSLKFGHICKFYFLTLERARIRACAVSGIALRSNTSFLYTPCLFVLETRGCFLFLLFFHVLVSHRSTRTSKLSDQQHMDDALGCLFKVDVLCVVRRGKSRRGEASR